MSLDERRTRWLFAGLGFGCFVLLLTLEIVTERDEFSLQDMLVDALTILLEIGTAVCLALLANRMHVQHEERLALIRDLEIARVEGDGWRDKVRSHMSGLKQGMEKQFADWGMTAAEREVALLILKGLSHKEIAALRSTSEATVRQQSQGIYRKADLPGKTAFCAYFLEDLFVPDVAPDGAESTAAPAPPVDIASVRNIPLGQTLPAE